MEVGIGHSTKDLAGITAEFAAKSMQGEELPPQLWLLMMDESQARELATEYAAPAEGMFAESPEVVNLPDGKAAIHFSLVDADDIRKLVDVLTSSVQIRCSGFAVQLPESDRSHLFQELAPSGTGLKMGDIVTFS